MAFHELCPAIIGSDQFDTANEANCLETCCSNNSSRLGLVDKFKGSAVKAVRPRLSHLTITAKILSKNVCFESAA
jgi:hypothetical protein